MENVGEEFGPYVKINMYSSIRDQNSHLLSLFIKSILVTFSFVYYVHMAYFFPVQLSFFAICACKKYMHNTHIPTTGFNISLSFLKTSHHQLLYTLLGGNPSQKNLHIEQMVKYHPRPQPPSPYSSIVLIISVYNTYIK